ncbi:hypothetical protein C8Q80DRAFT_1175274 [Daedaleopsis nitida]|nr:hypothetical protein C8Q80DRAFT_1175274 [Daedaleopsis nitida]
MSTALAHPLAEAPLNRRGPTSTLGQIPPLRGDGTGKYRVNIVGNSGAGKVCMVSLIMRAVPKVRHLSLLQSTLARELAVILDLPCILLDTIYWLPGWKECTRDEFRVAVRAALDQDARGWVVDGNYHSKLDGMVTNEATDVICEQARPSADALLPRLCWRTLSRLFRMTEQCSVGCEEMADRTFFSRDSIIWWCLSQHWPVRKREGDKHRIDGVHVGGKHRRIGGWGGELAAWKRDVQAMVEAERLRVTSS